MRKLLLLFLLAVCCAAAAQKKPLSYAFQDWVGYNPQIRFSKHWGTWVDMEVHSGDHLFNGYSLAIFRVAGTYYNNKNNKFTAGYGYADYFPGENHQHISIQEHFAWQQYQWYHRPRKSKIMQWLRLEEKFKQDVIDNNTAADSYTFTYKLRYNVFCTFPLSSRGLVKNSFGFTLGNELYLYYGPHINNHLFDQHRLFLGLSYAVNAHDNLVFGINNILQENTAGTQFKFLNILKVTFFENINL